jgi:MFS superfamily sulfate permease-like transporter
MSEGQHSQALRLVLIAVGLVLIFGVWLLMRIWPAGWQWQPNQPEYEHMFIGVYATLGVFLIVAAREPHKHRSLILFTAWSSLVHAGIMGVQALSDTAERGHLIGDVPALAIVGIVLLILAPKGPEPSAAT